MKMIRFSLKASTYITIFATIVVIVLLALLNRQNKQFKVIERQLYSPKSLLYQRTTDLKLKALCNGGLSLPNDDLNVYFLVEFKVMNQTIKTQEFITYSCQSLDNIVADSDEINFFYQNCASNYPIIIKLKPNQEFSVPIIIQVKRNSSVLYKKVKFGYIVMHPRILKNDEWVSQILKGMREQQENVIWSEPVELNATSFRPFEINDIIIPPKQLE